MRIEPIISYRNIDHSPAAENLVHRLVKMLDRWDEVIIGCEVMMEAPPTRRRQGHVFTVRLNLYLPDPDGSISREAAQGRAPNDLMLAVKRAFNAAAKALKKRKMTMGNVEANHHPPLLPDGFAKRKPAHDHGRVRFQHDSLTADEWDRPDKGSPRRFGKINGDKGPHAAPVTLAD